jgi:hypothetical protein
MESIELPITNVPFFLLDQTTFSSQFLAFYWWPYFQLRSSPCMGH